MKVVVLLFVVAVSFAQQIVPVFPGLSRHRWTEQLGYKTREKQSAIVLPGDVVLPHLVDGASWQTSVTAVNLESRAVEIIVYFISDDGSDLELPIADVGRAVGVRTTIPPLGSTALRTAGISDHLSSGWAVLVFPDNQRHTVGAFAIFRSRQPNGSYQEAVVPAANQFSTRFILPFDNTGPFITGVALTNPYEGEGPVVANIRNEAGEVIDTRQMTLPSLGHTAFALPSQWSSTANRRGIIEIIDPTGIGLTGLGLRFNGAAFTTLAVLENLDWSIGANAPPPSGGGSSLPGVSSACGALEGLVVYGNDAQFLGRITSNTFATDSIGNRFGNYGSEYSSVSIFNRYGKYGGEFSALSAFNVNATTPPMIYGPNGPLAYLTVNTVRLPRVNTYAIFPCIGRQ